MYNFPFFLLLFFAHSGWQHHAARSIVHKHANTLSSTQNFAKKKKKTIEDTKNEKRKPQGKWIYIVCPFGSLGKISTVMLFHHFFQHIHGAHYIIFILHRQDKTEKSPYRLLLEIHTGISCLPV